MIDSGYLIHVLFAGVIGMIYYGAHVQACNAVAKKYTKWKRLNELAATENAGRLATFVASMQMLWAARATRMIRESKRIDRHTYDVPYEIQGKRYNMVVKPVRGPTPIIQAIGDGEDFTDRLHLYLGPKYDWHGAYITPEFFEYENVTIEMLDGTQKTYTKNECFTLS